MTEQQQARFEGWAILDILGHQRYVGYVRTEAYGQAVMFRVDVPELKEREYTLQEPQYVMEAGLSQWCPVGTKVKREATPGYTKLIGASSIYSISPCDEAAALEAIEATQRPDLKLISFPVKKALAAAAVAANGDGEKEDDDEDEDEEDDDEDEDEEDDDEDDVPY